MDEHRYYDLKGDTTRVEVNVQERDKPLVVTGPIAVTEQYDIDALEASPGIKAITVAEYGVDPERLTVAQLDERYGDVDGYPLDGKKTDKVAFAKTTEGGH